MKAQLNINLSYFKVVRIIVFIITVFSFGFSGCRKYPDDPAFSKASLKKPEKKIYGKWKIKKAFVDGIDKTSETDFLQINYYRFYVFEYGTDPVREDHLEINTSNNTINNNPYISPEKYTWHNKYQTITFGSSYTKYPGFISIIPLFVPYAGYGDEWSILKLTIAELWMKYEYNGILYEVHFEKIE